MATDADRYEAWHSYKLWTLLPALYRAEDSDRFDEPGPLQELVARIGAEAAIVRRSIDRLWEDQSIETCDDWVIPYIGDLLATNLVASLDERGRRVDVGKTIYYRRRKGTLALAEELANDITGTWTVRVVEQFRRLGRTRHGLDPAIGLPSSPKTPEGQLQRAQGLLGTHTRTGAGGLADLRDVHGANLADSAFDEYFHTADVRRGRGATGRHNIARLGVFAWRLHSLGVAGVTAVHDTTCPNQYTFDPTGRNIKLFAPSGRNFADEWVSPREHQVPGPISADLLRTAFADLYHADTLFVQRFTGGPLPNDYAPVPAAEVAPDPRERTGHRFFIDPARGRTVAPAGVDVGALLVDYHYGFTTEIGAGPYERRVPGLAAHASPTPHFTAITGGTGLATVLGGSVPTGTVVIDDSRTYTDIANVTGVRDVEVRVKNLQRPLVRSSARAWSFTGVDDAVLAFDGLFLSGPDLVLRGSFGRVTFRCCTLDPGTWDGHRAFARSADDRALRSVRLRIEGTVRTLVIDRSIVGPIVERDDGHVEKLVARDSIIDACRPRRVAVSLASGEVELTRCTVLGTAQIHRLEASDSVLAEPVDVDDTQHGCVRFSAWTDGSTLPRQYESVMMPAETAVFASTSFGDHDYGQLLDSLGPTFLEGGEDGSEFGAFARERNAVKERSLLIKYQEYLPLGIEPVMVHVT